MSAAVYLINRSIQHHTNKNFIILMTSSRKRHQHDYRLIYGYFHKNLEIHFSSNLSNKQKHSAFTQTKIFFVWWRHHARGINMIIGSKMVASTKSLKFISAAVYQINRSIQHHTNKNFIILMTSHARGINMIIGS